MKNVIIDGVEVELDDGIDPEEVERYGADSRGDDEVDLDGLIAEAQAASDLEDDDAEEV